MKLVNCMLRADQHRAAENKVVDMAAWKAEHRQESDEPETRQPDAPGRHRGRKPVQPGRPTAWDWAELAATLAVAIVLVALAARVLLV